MNINSINTRKPMAFRSLLDVTAPLPANCRRLNNSFIAAVTNYRAELNIAKRKAKQEKPIFKTVTLKS